MVAAWLLLALLLPWCVATGAINAATRGLLELRRRALDERQRAERSEVLARAHRITTALLLATAAAAGAYDWRAAPWRRDGLPGAPRRARRALADADVGGGPARPGRAGRRVVSTWM